MTASSSQHQLETHRQSIDEIDQKLLMLLTQRFEHSKAIGQLKQTLEAKTVFDPEREAGLIARLAARLSSSNPLHDEALLHALWRPIFSLSRDLQRPIRIGADKPSLHWAAWLLGPFGSFELEPEQEAFTKLIKGQIDAYVVHAPIKLEGHLKLKQIPLQTNHLAHLGVPSSLHAVVLSSELTTELFATS